MPHQIVLDYFDTWQGTMSMWEGMCIDEKIRVIDWLVDPLVAWSVDWFDRVDPIKTFFSFWISIFRVCFFNKYV